MHKNEILIKCNCVKQLKYQEEMIMHLKIESTVITRQARHDLLEKYRPRILMTEAELAEDAVIINIDDDIIIALYVKSTV